MGTEAGKPISVKGYVLDSACAFTKNLKKPISTECAVACAKAGSPLVILSDEGTIYWPIAETTPSSGQNERVLPFAGKKVAASGKVFQRGGSSALVIKKDRATVQSELNSLASGAVATNVTVTIGSPFGRESRRRPIPRSHSFSTAG